MPSFHDPAEYKVVMIYPGYDEGRENAQGLLQAALDHLNIPNYEPGTRFAPNVRASLEVVSDIEEAQGLIRQGHVAQIIAFGVDERHRIAFAKACAKKHIEVAYMVDTKEIPSPTGEEIILPLRDTKKKNRGSLVFSPGPKEIPAEFHDAALLSAPTEEDAESRGVIAVQMLAMGVMKHHFEQTSGKSPQ